MKYGMRLLLATASTLTTLVVLEIGARALAYRSDLRQIQRSAIAPGDGEPASLGEMLRLSENRKVIYELIPNMSVRFIGQSVKTNSLGFRGGPVSIEKPGNTVRIVGLGDSIMFGWGVREEDSYLRILCQMLNSKYTDDAWELVNTAVPGYNTVMEVETLKEKGLRHGPDLVIIQYLRNDISLPNFIVDRQDYFSSADSFLWNTINRRLNPPGLIGAPASADGSGFEDNPGKVPPQYRDLVGIDSYRKAMQELQRSSQEHGFDVIVLCNFFSRNGPVREICTRLGLRTVDTEAAWRRYCAMNRIEDCAAAWRLSQAEPHPSVAAHKVIAETLLTYLEESGMAQRMVRLSRTRGPRRSAVN